MNRNYSRELETILCQPKTLGKKLFLHSCCAPCSSYVLEYLRPFFCITVFYYNPNITSEEEYVMRREEQCRLIGALNQTADSEGVFLIDYLEGRYEPERFVEQTKGMERCAEGGERCLVCYALRLQESARLAREYRVDYFTTTLTISPLKNAEQLNEIGEQAGIQNGIPFLPSDFKKKDGYKRSLELSEKYGLYRQNYCGCRYSLPD